MVLRTTANKVKELTNKLLGTHEFPQCLGIIDDTRVQLNITQIISTERIIFPERSSCVRLKILL